jgi:hypothetical protein
MKHCKKKDRNPRSSKRFSAEGSKEPNPKIPISIADILEEDQLKFEKDDLSLPRCLQSKISIVFCNIFLAGLLGLYYLTELDIFFFLDSNRFAFVPLHLEMLTLEGLF